MRASLLGALILAGCTEAGTSVPGLEAKVTAVSGATRASSAESPTANARTFHTAEGYRVDLLNGMLVISPVTVVECPTMDTVLSGLLLPAAHAHGGHLEAPSGVIDVSAATTGAWPLGALPVAPGTYCTLEIELWPLPSGAGDLAGAALYVAPCWYPEPDQVFHTCYRLPIHAAIRRLSLEFPSPITVNEANRSMLLTVEVHHDLWFDGVSVPDLASEDVDLRAAAAAKLLDNVASSLVLSDDPT